MVQVTCSPRVSVFLGKLSTLLPQKTRKCTIYTCGALLTTFRGPVYIVVKIEQFIIQMHECTVVM